VTPTLHDRPPGFLLDTDGRRALAETLADWREERRLARNPWRRALADARGGASVLRATATLALWQCKRRDVWSAVGIATLLAVAMGGLLSAPLYLTIVGGSVVDRLELVALTLPDFVIGQLPAALAIGPGLRRGRAIPMLGQFLMADAWLLLLGLWVAPAATEAVWLKMAALYSIDPAWLLSHQPPHWTLPERLWGLLPVLVAAPTFLVLGRLFRERLSGRWRPWLAQIVVGAVTLALLFAPRVLAASVRGSSSDHRSPVWLLAWLAPTVMAWLLIAILSRWRRQTSESFSPTSDL
jgi:hypothetical protein